jgi:hypothetical protein
VPRLLLLSSALHVVQHCDVTMAILCRSTFLFSNTDSVVNNDTITCADDCMLLVTYTNFVYSPNYAGPAAILALLHLQVKFGTISITG